ncbi:unnamed protein product [Bursaphelenchus xylophilus]|uniref:(pine wood nematode) hypothetical protein n=1 Tax=Bursaphelenchus xylophilus TaxID=6326 RepID=A0A1I7S5Q1_BURXY|nr:unnamed protein product [Bursaphelenchus xylophilus]CAG9124952.1 unnamed protein product [Bursaphelenchus xylophilus]
MPEADAYAMMAQIQWTFEIVIGLLSFAVNIYSWRKFKQVQTFSLNLRFMLRQISFLGSAVALTHPILCSLPSDFYAYDTAAKRTLFLYFLHFICNICLTVNDVKHLLIAVERHYALKYRTTYENRDNLVGKVLFYGVMSVATLIFSARAVFFLFYNSENIPLDVRLHRSFVFEGSIYFFTVMYGVASISVVAGMVKLSYIQKTVQTLHYTGDSLSERFLLKEMTVVVDCWKVLVRMFGVGLVIAYIGLCGIWYCYKNYYFFALELQPEYKMWSNIAFLALSGYNLVSSMSLLWLLRPIRKLIQDDLHHYFGIRSQQVDVVTRNDFDGEDHFDYLKKVWNIPK